MRVIDCGCEGSPQPHQQLVYYGACLSVNLGFDPSWNPERKAPPLAGISDLEALIDTGAEESCIDSALAAQLNLPLIDKRPIVGVGQMDADVHLAQVFIRAMKYTIRGHFAAVPLQENGHRQRVLLGRTFLRDCLLVYDGRSAKVTIQIVG
jgi:predicted aspartyl protease